MDTLRKAPKQHPAQRLNVPADAPDRLTIRHLEQEDLPVLLQLCEAHARWEECTFHPQGKMDRWRRQLFNPDFGVHCWLLECAGQVVGYATFMEQYSTWEADFYLYLDCLYIEAAFRGRGFGAQLMQALQASAQSHDYPVIQWQTPMFNHSAIAFYQRLGAAAKTKERFFWHLG